MHQPSSLYYGFYRRKQRERRGKEGKIMRDKIMGRIANLRFEISKLKNS
jgi:hypothetical protein